VPHEQLTKLEVSLLTYLYRNIGRLCSFDDIALQVWDDPQWAPENNTISRAVTNLRKKLNDFSPGAGEYIQNIRGQGYKLVRKKE
jgi:DNA-binding response OmpR family regulator